jgi:hypothetical protein
VHFNKTLLGSGSRLSPSSLLPRPRNQRKPIKTPFSPVTPTLLTRPRHGVTGVTVLTVQAGYRHYTFQKTLRDFITTFQEDGKIFPLKMEQVFGI